MALTFQNLALILGTAGFTIQKFYMVFTFPYVFCTVLISYTLLTDCSLITEIEGVYCAVHTESSYKTDCVSFLRLILAVL
jgi:hypothetical protein